MRLSSPLTAVGVVALLAATELHVELAPHRALLEVGHALLAVDEIGDVAGVDTNESSIRDGIDPASVKGSG